MLDILYICDKHACQRCCSHSGTNGCKHTTNPKHAINKNRVYSYFDIVSNKEKTALVELSKKDRNKKEN